MTISRGDAYYAQIEKGIGSEQDGDRIVIIIQNDIGNKYSPTIIGSFATSSITKASLPTHVKLSKDNLDFESDLRKSKFKNSIVLLEQVRTLDKLRLGTKVGRIHTDKMHELDRALAISVGLFII